MGLLSASRRLQAEAIEWGRWAGALGDVRVNFGGFDLAVVQHKETYGVTKVALFRQKSSGAVRGSFG